MSDSVEMAQFNALLEWRGASGANIRDSLLQDIVQRCGSDPQAGRIRIMLSAQNRDHAEAIAQTMREAMGAGAPATPPPGPQAPAEAPPHPPGPAHAPSAPVTPATSASEQASSRPTGGVARTPSALPGVIATYEDPNLLAEHVALFTAFDYSTDGQVTPTDLRTSLLAAGGLALQWRPLATPESETALYRVVSSDDDFPWSPDPFETVVVTTGTQALDLRAPVRGVRHYTVWAHVGDTPETAYWNQPVLLATGTSIARPRNPMIFDEGEGAVATWSVLPPTTKVDVFRFEAGKFRGLLAPEAQLFPDETNLGGFRDDDVTPGVKYEYRIIAHVPSQQRDGTTAVLMATAVVLSYQRVGHPLPVEDLRYTVHGVGDAARFDLSWTPPRVGEVRFYRSEKRPRTGIEQHEASLDVIDQMELGDFVPGPRDVDPEGRATMKNVSWPRGWVRVYMTPVTVVGDRIRPGVPEAFIRVPPVADPVIHQRVGFQKLAFAWPRKEMGDGEAADVVNVYESVRGVSSEDAMLERPLAEVSLDSYERDGGVVFSGQGELRPEGSTLHLVPFAFSRGQRIAGPPVTVDYPGLVQVAYQIDKPPSVPFARVRKVSVRIAANIDLPKPPKFCLVHNPDRLPLDYEDGTRLTVTPRDQAGASPMPWFGPATMSRDVMSEAWIAEAPKSGFVRLFAHVGGEHVRILAVLDPPVRELSVG